MFSLTESYQMEYSALLWWFIHFYYMQASGQDFPRKKEKSNSFGTT